MNEKIKPTQYMFLIVGFITGSILLVRFLEVKNDTWIIAILGFIVIIPFLLCYAFISKKFPGKNLIEINNIVYGKVIGKVVSILYIYFFLSICSFNIREVGVFYTGFVMPETPLLFFLIATTILCAYAVKKGIAVIARVSFILVILVISVVVLIFVLLIGKMDFSNFLPILDAPADTMYHSTQTMSMVPYGEVVIFLMVMPHVEDNKKLVKNTVLGLGIAALIFLNLAIRNTATLGASGQILAQPSFQAVRLINIGDFLNRIEILIALNNTGMMFLKISVTYYATVSGIAQILNLRTYKPLIIPVGILAVIYALIVYTNEVRHHYWGLHYASFFEIPFVVFFPLFTILIIKLRKSRGRNRQDFPADT